MAHPAGGYKTRDGKRVPGVTTIIGRFKDSGGLLYWACEQGKAIERGEINNLYDKRDAAAESGTGTHFLVYRHVHGLSPLDLSKLDELDMGDDGKIILGDDMRQQIQTGFDAYLKWERMTKLKIVLQEMRLVDEEHEFGGTPDAIGTIDSEMCLIDWKTSSGVYPDFLVQIAAYKRLVEHGRLVEHDYKLLRKKIKGFHLCRFSKDFGAFTHHYWPELDAAWEQFLLFRRAYDIDKLLKRMAK